MNRAEIDPRVSCPIVAKNMKDPESPCYGRGTGFFFKIDETTYLITNRHIVLPTYGTKFETGDITLVTRDEQTLPRIDIYLRTNTGFDRKEVDLRQVDGVKHSHKLDVAGIPIEVAPAEYGYTVWEPADVVSPTTTTDTLEIIGFDIATTPDEIPSEYPSSRYSNQIGLPALCTVINKSIDESLLSHLGLIAVGLNKNPEVTDADYDGLSGAPILGDGLVGIHSGSKTYQADITKSLGFDGLRNMIFYWRAELLEPLLDPG